MPILNKTDKGEIEWYDYDAHRKTNKCEIEYDYDAHRKTNKCESKLD